MVDYAASPLQPIANLLLNPVNVPIVGASPLFLGRGISSVVRTAGGAPLGDFTLTLDLGLPGDLDFFTGSGYTLVTQRGVPLAGGGALAGGTAITEVAVTYPTIYTVRLVFSIASVGTDPEEADVIIWRAPLNTIAGGGGGGGGGGIGTPVPLGAAAGFTLLAKSGISTIPTSSITGNVGLSPAAASFLTGWSQVLDGSGVFSTSTQVNAPGELFAADYAPPTPANLTVAVLAMQAAYTAAAAYIPNVINLGGGNIGGRTLPPGVYFFDTVLLIPLTLTLNGGPNDVWVFQTTGGITQSVGVQVVLTGGAQAKNVFWQSAGVVALQAGAVGAGIYLSQVNISLGLGATVNGQLYAQTAITLDAAVVAHS